MITRVGESEYMTCAEMNKKFNGLQLLIKQEDKSKHLREGFIVAMTGDSDAELEELWNLKDAEYPENSFVYYASIDKGDDLHVTLVIDTFAFRINKYA